MALRGFRKVIARQRAHRPDYKLMITTYGLLAWGLIMIYSIGPVLARASGISVTKQFLSIGVASLAFWLAAKASPLFWKRVLPILIVLAVVSTALLLIPSELITSESGGARRWLNIAGVSFQPSELVKLTAVVYFAVFLSSRMKLGQVNDRKMTLYPSVAFLSLVALFVAGLQRDLGTMMVIAAIVLGMLYVAGLPRKDLLKLAGFGLVAVFLLIAVAPYRFQRFTTFLSPESDPLGAGYHIQQSLVAIGSGGIGGQGIGHSIQAFGYLPEAANDSIFAIHAETIGFIGIVILLTVIGFLLKRIQLQAVRADSDYHQLLVTGIFAWLASHFLINIGAMLGLMPLTGITLPLLSYGGSSMVFIMIGLGIVFHLSRYSQMGLSPGRKRLK